MMKRKNPMKYVVLIGAVSAGLLSACSHGQTAEAAKTDRSSAEVPQTAESFTVSAAENPVSAGETESAEMESAEMESTEMKNAEMENTEMGNTLDDSRIITGQSFDVTWKNWGEVRFISYAPPADHAHDDVKFYLSKNNEIVYEFPKAWAEGSLPWTFESVDMVSFRDIDGDGYEDVITIISYITGAGTEAMVPFPTTRIFLGDGTKFVLDAELSEAVDKAQANESISTIMEFINNRTSPDAGYSESAGGEDQMYEITGIREEEAKAFLKKFAAHVKAGEKKEASRMIAFPKKVVLPDKQVTVQSPEEFLAYYDEIFTADYRERIGQLMAEDDVWWSYRGVAVGNGEVWLNERDGTLWIEALNNGEDRAVQYPENTGIQAE